MGWVCRFCIIMAGLIPAGCANSNFYSQPASLTAQNAATLIGSRVHDPNPLMLDILIMPAQIDGRIMGSQWYNDSSSRWNEAFLITPDQHRIMIEISIGGTFTQTAWGNANIDLAFQPGKTYHIMATPPVPIPGARSSLLSYAWLQDDAGDALTPRIPVQIGVYTGGDMIGLPSGGGQTPNFVQPHS